MILGYWNPNLELMMTKAKVLQEMGLKMKQGQKVNETCTLTH
jgi:hypothetical protein